MNVIEELVTEISDVAEDKNAYEVLRSEGLDPFGTKKVSDVCKASEISSLILNELIEKVDGCDSSFANLVFLQTEEGLRDLQKKIKAKESLENGEGGFFRTYSSELSLEPHEITPDESKAVGEFVNAYGQKVDSKLDTDYSRHLSYQNLKAQDALKGNGNGSFRRE